MRFLAVPAALFALIACAGPEDLSAECATLNDYCASRAKTECTTQVVSQCQAKDISTCVADRTAACLKAVPQGTVYVPTAGPACLKAVAAAYVTATITADALDTISTQCEPIFSGPGAARSPCTVDYDCSTVDGLRCLIAFGETSGKCMAPNMIDEGAPCPGEADICSGAYFCEPKSKVCVALGGDGSQCSPEYQPCMKGFRCPGSIFVTTCQALAAAGNACTTADECASGLCDKATGQSQGVCADQIQLTALDSLCAIYQ